MALTNDEAELTRKAKTREYQTSYKCDDAGERNRKVRHALENKEKDTTL